MSMPDNGRDQRGRIDLFQPNSLTHEEAELLKKLRFESTWRRGYPLAIIVGSAAAFMTKKFSMVTRIALTGVGAIAGNIAGRVSYLPTIQARLLSDLPESSPLRQKMETFKQKGAAGFAERFGNIQQQTVEHNEEHDTNFDTGSEYDQREMEPQDGDVETEQKKFVTYQELRERNRKGVAVSPKSNNLGSFGQFMNSPTPSSDSGPVPHQEGETFEAPKKIRYNKYGDPIVE